MREHYGLNEEQFSELLNKGVTVADLFHAVKDFSANEAPVSKISLFHYADKHGDFTEEKSKLDIIANTVFKTLPVSDQIEIGEYFDWLENGAEEDEE